MGSVAGRVGGVKVLEVPEIIRYVVLLCMLEIGLSFTVSNFLLWQASPYIPLPVVLQSLVEKSLCHIQ